MQSCFARLAPLHCAALLVLGVIIGRAAPLSAQAEHYPVLSVGVGVGAVGGLSIGAWGAGGHLEIAANVTDQLAIGGRVHGAGVFGGSIPGGSDSLDLEMQALAALLVKADYFFTTSTIRPFGSLALGVYWNGSQSIEQGAGMLAVAQQASQSFGLAPQLGLQLGGFRLAISYHILPSGGVTASQEINTGSGVGISQRVGSSVSMNYLYIELGWRFGNDRKEPSKPAAAK